MPIVSVSPSIAKAANHRIVVKKLLGLTPAEDTLLRQLHKAIAEVETAAAVGGPALLTSWEWSALQRLMGPRDGTSTPS